MSQFALKTLLADRGKLLTALIGVVFSLVLVNIQGGLFFGLMDKSTVLIDNTGADFWIGHRLVENVDLAHDIPEAWLNRIKGLPNVELAEPYVVGKGIATLKDGGYEDVWIIGSDAASMLGSGWSFVVGNLDSLRRPDAVCVDELDGRKLGFPNVGETLEINSRRARVVAKTHGILGFLTIPYVFTTLDNARGYANIPDGYCSYFLVRAARGANLTTLARDLRQRLPELDVHTADSMSRISRDYWMHRTGIGVSFGAATLLGLLVGLLMVGQSLYALALDHLSDYATLKAIGADDRQVCRVVILQALTIASIGSAVGLAMVLFIQGVWSTPLAPIKIPPQLLCGAVVLAFGICLGATVLPFWRIRRVDPALVLQH